MLNGNRGSCYSVQSHFLNQLKDVQSREKGSIMREMTQLQTFLSNTPSEINNEVAKDIKGRSCVNHAMQRSKKESGAFIRNKCDSLCGKRVEVTTLPLSSRKKRRILSTNVRNHNIHDRIIAKHTFLKHPGNSLWLYLIKREPMSRTMTISLLTITSVSYTHLTLPTICSV